MKTQSAYVAAMLLFAWAAPSWAQSATPTPDCEAVRCSVQSTINACATNATNHGQFVSCVAHAIKSATPPVPKQCRGKVMRCAGDSTFGKANFETCTRQKFGTCTNGVCNEGTSANPGNTCTVATDCLLFGTCDVATGTCTSGMLATGLTSCASDSDCLAAHCNVARIRPTPTPDKCTALGGSVGTGSCCASCP